MESAAFSEGNWYANPIYKLPVTGLIHACYIIEKILKKSSFYCLLKLSEFFQGSFGEKQIDKKSHKYHNSRRFVDRSGLPLP